MLNYDLDGQLRSIQKEGSFLEQAAQEGKLGAII